MVKDHKYAEKCETCGKMVKKFDTSTGKIICESCINNDNRKELDVPIQTDLYDLLYGNGNCKIKIGIDLGEGVDFNGNKNNIR